MRRVLAVSLFALALACHMGLPGQTGTSRARGAGQRRGDRSHGAPDPEPTTPPITELDARKAKAPPRFEVKAPKGAPNVVIVLIDDIGFGMTQRIRRPDPHAHPRAAGGGGLRYNRFHTTALCSPTRTALLTGRNHHANNAGAIMETRHRVPRATPACAPASVTPLAEILPLNGYSTRRLRQVPRNRALGSRSRRARRPWPTAPGSTSCYGFIGGATRTSGRRPSTMDNSRRAAAYTGLPLHDGHDEQGDQVGEHAAQSLTPDKPFFMYFATGRHACAAPRPERSGSRSTRGSSTTDGTRCARRSFARQKQLGVVRRRQADARSPGDPRDGTAMSATRSGSSSARWRRLRRLRRVHRHEVGRLIDALKGLGASSTTRSCSTSSATTARARKAAGTGLQRDDGFQRPWPKRFQTS